jgi:hypothetical protein
MDKGKKGSVRLFLILLVGGGGWGGNVHVTCSGYGLLIVGLCDQDIQDFLKLGNFLT